MNSDLQLLAARLGVPSMMIFFIGMLLMTFLPPLSPALDAAQVAAIYQHNATGIRAGAVCIIVSTMLAVPFYAVISIQLRALEGSRRPVMSYAQLAAGTANLQFFILPGLLFAVASFRPDRPIEITYMLNDLAFLVTILPWPISCIQMAICGAAILVHAEGDSPVFPRWIGYFNVWGAVLFLPGALIPFFKTGPFAWNGIFSFWIPATAFGMWFFIMQIWAIKAIKRERLTA